MWLLVLLIGALGVLYTASRINARFNEIVDRLDRLERQLKAGDLPVHGSVRTIDYEVHKSDER